VNDDCDGDDNDNDGDDENDDVTYIVKLLSALCQGAYPLLCLCLRGLQYTGLTCAHSYLYSTPIRPPGSYLSLSYKLIYTPDLECDKLKKKKKKVGRSVGRSGSRSVGRSVDRSVGNLGLSSTSIHGHIQVAST
jgi:hypothetical protein